MEPTTETALAKCKTLLARVTNIKDQAIAIEQGIGVDTLMSLISSGMSESLMADAMGMNERELSLVLRQTPSLRHKYLEARAFKLADSSVDVMDTFSDVTTLDKMGKNALDYHSSNLDRSLKNYKEGSGNNGVIIHNVLSVRDPNDVPPLPPELEQVFDAEVIDVGV